MLGFFTLLADGVLAAADGSGLLAAALTLVLAAGLGVLEPNFFFSPLTVDAPAGRVALGYMYGGPGA